MRQKKEMVQSEKDKQQQKEKPKVEL